MYKGAFKPEEWLFIHMGPDDAIIADYGVAQVRFCRELLNNITFNT
jgi:hypothetical protein